MEDQTGFRGCVTLTLRPWRGGADNGQFMGRMTESTEADALQKRSESDRVDFKKSDYWLCLYGYSSSACLSHNPRWWNRHKWKDSESVRKEDNYQHAIMQSESVHGSNRNHFSSVVVQFSNGDQVICCILLPDNSRTPILPQASQLTKFAHHHLWRVFVISTYSLCHHCRIPGYYHQEPTALYKCVIWWRLNSRNTSDQWLLNSSKMLHDLSQPDVLIRVTQSLLLKAHILCTKFLNLRRVHGRSTGFRYIELSKTPFKLDPVFDLHFYSN